MKLLCTDERDERDERYGCTKVVLREVVGTPRHETCASHARDEPTVHRPHQLLNLLIVSPSMHGWLLRFSPLPRLLGLA